MAETRTRVLDDAQKTFVVQSLACFDAPSVVAKALREEFGVAIAPQSIEAYDPTKRAGWNLSEKWRLLFEETRQAFLKDTSAIGASHRAVRVRVLDRMARRAEEMSNLALAAALLEQAAKEMGDAFTNRQRVESDSTVRVISAEPMSEQEWEAKYGEPGVATTAGSPEGAG